MQNTKTSVPFTGTAQQEEKLLAVIASHQHERGALMAILHQAQEIYGYLPYEVQVIVARELQKPIEEVYGVVSFYSQFSLSPKGKYPISVCLGTACYVKGAGEIAERFAERLGIEEGECTPDGKFSLEPCRCIGACGLAPVLTINEDVYGRVTLDEVDEILAKYEN